MKKRNVILLVAILIFTVLILSLVIGISNSPNRESSFEQNTVLKEEEIESEIDSEDFESIFGDMGEDADEDAAAETGGQATSKQVEQGTSENEITEEETQSTVDGDMGVADTDDVVQGDNKSESSYESNFDVVEDETTKYGPVY